MFHDCTGPVVLAASTHLALNAPNALVQETVRAFYSGWYGELVTQLPPIQNGTITAPPGPGHGIELLPDLTSRKDVEVTVSDDPARSWSVVSSLNLDGSSQVPLP
jgi:L-alanine-DL-glutamate epimerase-like enolase superfamily enzyme